MSQTILLKNGSILSHDEDDKHVKVLRNTDLLIEGNTITKIAQNIDLPQDASHKVVDCTDKIISPGFINTHAHLWQTQLKGRHADENLLAYIPSGNFQHNHYSPEDIYWGQLAGALESVDAGTTFVLDHAHCARTEEIGEQALAATVASGVRCVFGYGKPVGIFEKWDMNEVVPTDEQGNLGASHIERLVRAGPYAGGRVIIGHAFDAYFLPEEVVKGHFKTVTDAGVKVVTSHLPNFKSSQPSNIPKIVSWDLHTTTPHLVLSHCTNLPASEYETLKQHQIAISSTPETEAQMGHGAPVLFTPGLNTSIGVDCHTNNTSFMPTIARTGLFCARLQTNEELLARQKFPARLRGTTEAAFNKMTVDGARQVGLENEIGSLRVGKRADVVVFDAVGSLGMSCVGETDPLCAVVRHSCVRDVEMVVVDGVVRKENRVLLPVTVGLGLEERLLAWPDIRRELLASMREVVARDRDSSWQVALDHTLTAFGVDKDIFEDVL